MRSLVTVCLPVFNGEDFLEDALDSVLAQTETDFEVLVPDDCSEDSSFEIIERYARKDRRVKGWRNGERLGLFGNYNQCLRNAQGNYIKPMAQDDLILPSMLEQCISVLSAHKEVSLVSAKRVIIDQNSELVDLGGECTNPATLFGVKNSYQSALISEACLSPLQNIIGEPCAVMFRAGDIGEGFSEKLRHIGDLEFWLRILKNGDYAFIPEELVRFRRHDKSATARNLRQLLLASDIVHMAELSALSLNEIGLNKDGFILSNLSCLALNMRDLIEAGELPEGELLADGSLSRDEEFGIKKALIYGFFLIAENPEFQMRATKEKTAIGCSEAKLRMLLESFPWRSTRVLRELNKCLSLRSDSSGRMLEINEIELENSEYIQFLRKQRARILKSRSWKFGRAFQSMLQSAKLG